MASADIPDDIPLALLDRYLAGETAGTERATVERWLRGHPGHRRILDAMRGISDVPGGTDLGSDSAAMWQALECRLSAARPEAALPQSRSDRPGVSGLAITQRRWPRGGGAGMAGHRVGWLGSVAVMAGLAVSAVLGWWGWHRGDAQSAQQFREFASAPGARLTVTLHDGTRLVLGPASRLRVPATFGRTERAVELDGEALFAVVHDDRRPFAVRTARTLVRDVGTTFIVCAYPGDAQEHIGVVEGEVRVGRVAVRSAARAVPVPTRSLRARDLASVTDTGIIVAHGADVMALAAWTQGRLAFRDTPFADVTRQLARAFDLDIVVADSALLALPVTASFSDEQVDEVLAAVTLPVGAQVQRTGRHVVIRRRIAGYGKTHRPTGSAQELNAAQAQDLSEPARQVGQLPRGGA